MSTRRDDTQLRVETTWQQLHSVNSLEDWRKEHRIDTHVNRELKQKIKSTPQQPRCMVATRSHTTLSNNTWQFVAHARHQHPVLETEKAWCVEKDLGVWRRREGSLGAWKIRRREATTVQSARARLVLVHGTRYGYNTFMKPLTHISNHDMMYR